MKTKLLILLIVLIFSCKEKETNKIPSEDPKIVQKICVDKPKPRSLDELNEMVKFNVNLDNQCEFQPVHMEICGTKMYTIIGRFKSKKKNGNNKKITSIELYVYNLSQDEEEMKINYKVVKIYPIKKDKDVIELGVELSSDPNIPENPIYRGELKLTKKMLLDFNVEDGRPCLFEGRICKTNVVFE